MEHILHNDKTTLLKTPEDRSQKEILSPFVIVKNLSFEDTALDLDSLSDSEKKRYSEIQDPTRQLQFYWGRYYLRFYLGDIFSSTLKDVPLFTDEKGKPYVKNNRCFVSLSHSDKKLGLIISPFPCGIDLERIVHRSTLDSMMKKLFTEDEILEIQKNAIPMNEFYKKWTLKEALFKMNQNTDSQHFKNSKNLIPHSQVLEDYALSYVWCR